METLHKKSWKQQAEAILQPIQYQWKTAWQIALFRRLFLGGFIYLVCFIGFVPNYFAYVQQREGIVLPDPLLELIPPHEVSTYIFGILYPTLIAMCGIWIQYPRTFLQVLIGLLSVQTLRLISIWLIPLNPPTGCLVLADPLVNFFAYAHQPITKDLFFSGHVATMTICYLSTPKKRRLILGAIILMIIMLLLMQHAHYSIDILGALLITPLAWKVIDIYFKKHLSTLTDWREAEA